MGYLRFDDTEVGFDDRILTHLEVVIVKRFLEEKNVLLSWLDPLATGDGRSSIWLTHATTLQFKFSGSRTAEIDRDWLSLLSERANSSVGLVVCGPDGRALRAESHRHARVYA